MGVSAKVPSVCTMYVAWVYLMHVVHSIGRLDDLIINVNTFVLKMMFILCSDDITHIRIPETIQLLSNTIPVS